MEVKIKKSSNINHLYIHLTKVRSVANRKKSMPANICQSTSRRRPFLYERRQRKANSLFCVNFVFHLASIKRGERRGFACYAPARGCTKICTLDLTNPCSLNVY